MAAVHKRIDDVMAYARRCIATTCFVLSVSAWAQTSGLSGPFDPGSALGDTGLSWITGGDAPWAKTSVVYDTGSEALASGIIGNGQVSWLQTTVTGPGTVIYRWAVDSEWGYDALKFSVNGSDSLTPSGFFPWTQQIQTIAEVGSVDLRWAYHKDGSVSVGRDQAYLDQVLWIPAGSGGLSIKVTGNGAGVVESTDNGQTIDCGPTCIANLALGSTLTLTATPATGSVFEGWSGACSGTGSCEITIAELTEVLAEFSTAALPEALSNDVPVTGIDGRAMSARGFYIDVPSGARDLMIRVSDGVKRETNSAFLMVGVGRIPTGDDYDCFPLVTNSHQVCAFAKPVADRYHILVGGQSDVFSGIQIKASYGLEGMTHSVTVGTNTGGRVVSSNVQFPIEPIDLANPVPQVIGGGDTTITQWPWQVQVRAGGSFCSGSLIDAEWVISAAHCLDGASSASVAVGRTALNSGGVTIGSAEIIVHEGYVEAAYRRDIALIRLSTPVNLGSSTQPIELLSVEQESNLAADGVLGTVTGWGYTREGAEQPQVLQVADVAIIGPQACRNLRYSALSITDDMICAGFVEGGVDTCAGDSGGPLVVRDGLGGYRLAGITSWGNDCALAGYPGVYARVSSFIDWISDKTGLVFSDKILDCGDQCQVTVPDGTQLTLVPEVDPGYFFVGFDGICAGQMTCSLTINEARTVNALFQAEGIFRDRFEVQ